MATLLNGPNLSGRSGWLAKRRSNAPWPDSTLIGAFPELACTGLTSTVSEELERTLVNTSMTEERRQKLLELFAVTDLMNNEISALSGGESVRVAMMSVAAQGVTEVHVDTALEQLDALWRSTLMRVVAQSETLIAPSVFVSDNHLTATERGLFDEVVEFRASEIEASPTGIDAEVAAENFRERIAPPIVVDAVSFTYAKNLGQVLKRVSLSLEPGTMHFFVGPNGSGKTTFVKLLSGTLLPDAGSIRFGSQLFSPSYSRQRFAALAFQNPDFQWTAHSVRDELRKVLSSPDETVGEKLLPAFGVPASSLAANPNELPFVWKKRLSVALAFLARKPWLILDEPTLGQDASYRSALAGALRNVLALGAGAIIITHDQSFRSLFPNARLWQFGSQSIVPDNSSRDAVALEGVQ